MASPPATDRPVPVPTADDRAFWEGGAVGELRIHRCDDCTRWHHPPAPVCRWCRSRSVRPTPVAGMGTVYTFTVNHQRWFTSMPPPYVVAVVELDEQPDLRVTANVEGCPPDAVHIGQRVAVRFTELGDGTWLPAFVPVPVPT